MGLLSFLFKGQKRKPAQQERKQITMDIEVSKYKDGFVRVDSIDFFAKGIPSPKEKFIISGYKNHLLVIDTKTQKVVHHIDTFQTISNLDVLITDDVYFIVVDTGRYEGLVNEIYCFGPTGYPLIHKRVDANIQSIGISDDRKYVCCQNANNHDHMDGGSLLIFDTDRNEIVHRWTPVTGWADSYSFDTKNKIISLHYKDSDNYRYTFLGELLDQEKWQEERHKKINGYQLLEIAYEQIDVLESAENDPDLKYYQASIDLIHYAVEKDISPYQKSLAYKKLGEIHLKFDHKSEALAYFQKAILNNPNIGLKRKVIQLEKELG